MLCGELDTTSEIGKFPFMEKRGTINPTPTQNISMNKLPTINLIED
jgi:hypothetical protein